MRSSLSKYAYIVYVHPGPRLVDTRQVVGLRPPPVGHYEAPSRRGHHSHHSTHLTQQKSGPGIRLGAKSETSGDGEKKFLGIFTHESYDDEDDQDDEDEHVAR